MDWVDGVILGALQGAAEFLPVSSSGHLRLGQLVLGTRFPAGSLALEVALHVATLAAVLLFFRREVWEACRGALALAGRAIRLDLQGWQKDMGARTAVLVVVATVPTGAIGLALKKAGVEEAGAVIVAACLLVTGVVNYGASRCGGGQGTQITHAGALWIGVAQGFAVLPGLSRSGATIACALALGTGREEAARFSFLASIPAVGGAGVLQALEVIKSPAAIPWGPLAAGMVVAFVVGLASLHALMRLLQGGRWHLFAYYCWAAGLATFLLAALSRS